MAQHESIFKKARRYQLELLEKAEKENTIVYLETGSGKTHIAVLLISSLSHLFCKPKDGICVFLAPTVHLCSQQADVLRAGTGLQVGRFFGGLGDDKKEMWEKELAQNEVFVMTPDVLLRNLRHAFFEKEVIKLLIFDECHHAGKGHPYANIMMEFYHSSGYCPRIFGMTASPIIKKGNSSHGTKGYENSFEHLEFMLRAKIYTVENRVELEEFVPRSKISLRYFRRQPAMTSKLEDIWKCTPKLLGGNEKKNLCQISYAVQYALTELGILCAKLAVEAYSKDKEINTNDTKGKFLGDMLSLFDGIELNGNLSLDSHFLSPKLHALLYLLLEYKSMKGFRCIIFVERVICATVICSLLSAMAAFSFLRCKCITSHRSSVDGTSRKGHDMALNEFRSGKINVLVATNVAEEGLDIPSCSVVIRFDLPKTERSFIQSKGRARQKNSQYVILLEWGNLDEEHLVMSLVEGERLMQEVVQGKEYTGGSSIDSEGDQKESYRAGSTGACINTSSSISLLYQYCSKLMGDSKSSYPEFRFQRDLKGIICEVSLPSIAPFEKAVGHPCLTEDLAKRVACLEACRRLHELGALSEHLLPIVRASRSTQKAISSIPASSNDTKDALEQHEMIVPDVLSTKWGKSLGNTLLYYYLLSFTTKTDAQYESVAFLVRKSIGDASSFDIKLVRKGEKITAHLTSQGIVELNPLQVQNAKIFQTKAFKTLFSNHPAEFIEDSQPYFFEEAWEKSSRFYLVLPLTCINSCVSPKSFGIDWARIQKMTSEKPSFDEADLEGDLETLQFGNRKVYKLDVDGTIVRTRYNLLKYYVMGIINGQNGNSDFPNEKYATYLDYFAKKHDIHLDYAEQPLLHAKPLGGVKHYLRKETFGTSGPSQKKVFSVELPPEVCTVEVVGLSCNFIKTLKMLPSCIHHIEGICTALQLKEELVRGFQKAKALSVDRILEAITTLGCCESFSLERLEFLGDSFLKFAITAYLFLELQNLAEGELSTKCAFEASNKNLHNLALKKNIQIFIRDKMFDPLAWEFPGSPYSTAQNGRISRMLAPKTIADVIEALIGACLMDGDIETALEFMDWLGLYVVSCSNIYIAEPMSGLDSCAKMIDKLQTAVGYEFVHKALLLEAFTHGSYSKSNGHSYQRLEFLGDAILGYLIALYVYLSYPTLNPGVLTELKCAMVSNNNFAHLAVKHKLYEFLLHDSAPLKDQITQFIHIADTPFCEWEFEAPKVLSDLVESLAAAIYIDSGCSLRKVWDVFQPIFDPMIRIEDLTLHPVKELLELCHRNGLMFNKSYNRSETKEQIVVEISATVKEHIVVGRGEAAKKSTAERLAARETLHILKGYSYEHPRHRLLAEMETLTQVNMLAKIQLVEYLTTNCHMHVPAIMTIPRALSNSENAIAEFVNTCSQMIDVDASFYEGFEPEPIEEESYLDTSGFNRVISSLEDLQVSHGYSHNAAEPMEEGDNELSPTLPEFHSTSSLIEELEGPVTHETAGVPRMMVGEICQKLKWESPQYECIKEEGPSHLKRFSFTYVVVLALPDGRTYEIEGEEKKTKTSAMDSAASFALKSLPQLLESIENLKVYASKFKAYASESYSKHMLQI